MSGTPNMPAWTPGPWIVNDVTEDTDLPGPVFDIDAANGTPVAVASTTVGNAEADARLIALAPEMAEAILALHDRAGDHQKAWDAVDDLAEKLRRIGATDAR